MQIVFKQNKRYGCSFYALANLFNDARYLDYIEEDQGGFVEHMNKAIKKRFPKMFLTCFFCVHSKLPVQNRFFDVALFEVDLAELPADLVEDGFKAMIATVRILDDLMHSILIIQRYKNEKFYVFNSAMQIVQEFTKEELVIYYWITEIYFFEDEHIRKLCTWGKPRLSLSWYYKHFPHLKPES